jgi:hypothetical protein
MKAISLFVLITMFLSLAGFQPDNKKEKKAKQQFEMAKLIDSGKFRFVARSANSELGYFNQITSNYDLIFDSLQIKAFLPYFGRAYNVPYGGNGGVKFDLQAGKINKEWNERKKMFYIHTQLADSHDSYSIYLTAGLSGFADLKINFSNRSWISFNGVIEKIESNKKKDIQ